jgi:ATP-binding cassette subfamily F protein 3
LLGLIAGTLEPTSGHIARNPGLRIATFSQHHVDGLDLALTPVTVMTRAYPNLKEQEARAHLGSFGVSGPLALQPLYTLSGGQKSRVAFAKVRVCVLRGGGVGVQHRFLPRLHAQPTAF